MKFNIEPHLIDRALQQIDEDHKGGKEPEYCTHTGDQLTEANECLDTIKGIVLQTLGEHPMSAASTTFKYGFMAAMLMQSYQQEEAKQASSGDAILRQHSKAICTVRLEQSIQTLAKVYPDITLVTDVVKAFVDLDRELKVADDQAAVQGRH